MFYFPKREKIKEKISELMHPIYEGDFDKALKSLDEEFVDSLWNNTAKCFVNYYKYSLRPLPPEKSLYYKALKENFIFTYSMNVEAYFIASIEKEPNTRVSAICDYMNYLFNRSDTQAQLQQAVEKLEKYMELYGKKTEFLERAVVLCSVMKDTEKLYSTLLTLVERKRESGSNEEVADMLLRIADCEYRLGNFEKSIETAEKAFNCGCWINGYAKQMVDSYIALSEYDKARNFMNTLFKSEESRISEKFYSYLSYKINVAEEKKYDAYRCVYDLNNDDFVDHICWCRVRGILNSKCCNGDVYFFVIDKYSLKYALRNVGTEKIDLKEPSYLSTIPDYYWSAFITKHFYGETKEYYEYICRALFYDGTNFGGELLDLDTCRSCLLSAVKFSYIIDGGNFPGKEQHTIRGLAAAYLNKRIFTFQDVCKLKKYYYVENPVLMLPAVNNDKYKELREDIDNNDKKFADAEQTFRNLFDLAKKNTDFKEETNLKCEGVARGLENDVLTFESDRNFIKEYADFMFKMNDLYKCDDYHERVRILFEERKRMLDLIESRGFRHRTTIFFENYFIHIFHATMDNLENFISETIASADFEEITNPYITGTPVVKDDMFFGRDELIGGLVKSIEDDRTRCIVIYGQKRSGKSSIFEHLKRRLVDKFIVVDFTLLSDVLNEQYFYKCIQKNLCHTLKQNHCDEKVVKTLKNRTISDFLDFEDFIQEVREGVCEPGNKELLLMIDEFTRIYEFEKHGDSISNFMDKWKTMVERNFFKSALIGQVNMPEFIREYPNQFQVTDLIRVSYLEKKYAEDLIVRPILSSNGKSRYINGAEKEIAVWFNGQPYFIQRYCHKLVNYLNMEKKQFITPEIAESVKNQMLAESGIDFFDNLVASSDAESWSVIEKIAKSDAEEVRKESLNLTDSEEKALEKLVDRDVVQKKPDNKYAIKIPFFREWVKEYK